MCIKWQEAARASGKQIITCKACKNPGIMFTCTLLFSFGNAPSPPPSSPLPPLLFSPWPSINKHSLWGNIKINSLGFLFVHLVMQFTSCPADNTPGQYHRPRTKPLGSVPSSPLHLPPPACFLPSGLRGTKHTPVPSVLPRNDTCWWHCPGTGTTQGAWLCPCYACRRLQIYIYIHTYTFICVYIFNPLWKMACYLLSVWRDGI